MWVRKISPWKCFQSSRNYLMKPKKFQVRFIYVIHQGHNRRFHQLVRNSDQRRRNREERFRQNENEEEEEEKIGTNRRDKIIADLQNKVRKFEAIEKENDKNSEINRDCSSVELSMQMGSLYNTTASKKKCKRNWLSSQSKKNYQ